MRHVTVHEVNKQLVVSLVPLPGFYKMGSCCIYDEEDKAVGRVGLWYSGHFFRDPDQDLQWQQDYTEVMHRAIRLVTNHASKMGLGTVAKRFRLSKRVEALLEKGREYKTAEHRSEEA